MTLQLFGGGKRLFPLRYEKPNFRRENKTMKFTHYAFFAILAFASLAAAQPRAIEKTATPPANMKPAPVSFTAKYEGGVFRFDKKEEGTLKFDDVNERLVFMGEDGKEKFGIPYEAMLIVFSDEKSVTSTAGNVVKYIPLPGAGLAGLIKEKKRYLVMQFDDPDVDAKGTTSFKLEDKDLLESVVHAVGQKAKMKLRGEAYIRPKVAKAAETN